MFPVRFSDFSEDAGAGFRFHTVDDLIREAAAPERTVFEPVQPFKLFNCAMGPRELAEMHSHSIRQAVAASVSANREPRESNTYGQGRIYESLQEYEDVSKGKKEPRAFIYESIDDFLEAMSQQDKLRKGRSGTAHSKKWENEREKYLEEGMSDEMMQYLEERHERRVLQAEQNRINGQTFSDATYERFKEKYRNAQREVYIMPNFTAKERRKFDIDLEKGAGKIRVDAIAMDKNGKIIIQEHKASATAPFTRNQKNGFDVIRERGGEVHGQGKGIFKKGFKFSSAEVQVVRPPPEGQEYVREKNKNEEREREEKQEEPRARRLFPRFKLLFH